MQTAELIVTVSAAGGQLWLEDGKVRARLPESLRPMLDALRAHKSEIAELLAQRPAMPAGVRLVSWNLKAAPIRLSQCETVMDVDVFIRSTLMQLESALKGRSWQSGNWGLSGLLERLAAVGCIVALENPRRVLQ